MSKWSTPQKSDVKNFFYGALKALIFTSLETKLSSLSKKSKKCTSHSFHIKTFFLPLLETLGKQSPQ